MPIPSFTAPDVPALGQSDAFLALQERISRAARTDRSIVFIGERGTGKELAAARLHLLSARWNEPYVTLNCAALAPSLIESELFGHEAGAFTGATRQRRGRFELAGGGSLFLDEVADIPVTVQEALLRVVEYGRFERVGGIETLQVDVRLITATNKNLPALAAGGRFRADLLDRLSFEVITLPPLRERGDDVLLLADHFARRMAVELGLGSPPEFTPAARRALLDHPWPGNVRELKNVVERMVYRCAGDPGEPCDAIDSIDFNPFAAAWSSNAPDSAASTSTFATAANPASPPFATFPADSPSLPSATSPAKIPAPSVHSPLPSAPAGHDPASRAIPTAPTSAPAPPAPDPLHALPLEDALAELRIRRIRDALAATRFNQRAAADRLGMTYHQFRGYYRKYSDRLQSGS